MAAGPAARPIACISPRPSRPRAHARNFRLLLAAQEHRRCHAGPCRERRGTGRGVALLLSLLLSAEGDSERNPASAGYFQGEGAQALQGPRESIERLRASCLQQRARSPGKFIKGMDARAGTPIRRPALCRAIQHDRRSAFCMDVHAWIRRCGGAAKCAAYNTASHVLHSKGDSNVNEEEMKEMEEIEETARALYEKYFQTCKKF